MNWNVSNLIFTCYCLRIWATESIIIKFGGCGAEDTISAGTAVAICNSALEVVGQPNIYHLTPWMGRWKIMNLISRSPFRQLLIAMEGDLLQMTKSQVIFMMKLVECLLKKWTRRGLNFDKQMRRNFTFLKVWESGINLFRRIQVVTTFQFTLWPCCSSCRHADNIKYLLWQIIHHHQEQCIYATQNILLPFFQCGRILARRRQLPT